MPQRRKSRNPHAVDRVVDGEPILDRLRVGDQVYLVLERLGTPTRPIFRVYEPGVVGEMRCLHLLPNAPATLKRLRVLSRAAKGHSNLPMILRSRKRKGDVAVVTKWIDGPVLRDYLGDCRRGREPWPSALIVMNLLRGLAHGIEYLQRRLGVVHGDLHPGNIILCRHTKRLVPIDFGSAWFVEQTKRREEGDGVMRSYAAPELIGLAGPPGFRSDQFSVMAIGYELLTGKLPYDGLGGQAALAGRGQPSIELRGPTELLKQPARLPDGVTSALDDLFVRSLSLSVDNRFPSGREWLDALGEVSRQLASTNNQLRPRNRWLLSQLVRLRKGLSLWMKSE